MRIPDAFQRLNDLVTKAKLSNRDTLLVGIYHDDPMTVPEAKLRSEAAITVPAKTKLPKGLTQLVVPAPRRIRARCRPPAAVAQHAGIFHSRRR
jgi:DNA gyrase inhibitor GyrI